jgi:hypothetical protein
MATPLDMSLLQHFSGLFLFIMIFAITYAVLGLTKVLGGENKSINAVVAFCFALFMTLASKPSQIVQGMVPWVGLVIIVIMFLIMAMRFMFGDEGDEVLQKVLGSSKQSAGWWIFLTIIGILLVSLGTTIGPDVTPGSNTSNTSSSVSVDNSPGSTQTGNWQANVLNTIYHPKVLGAVMILLIMLAAIKLLSTVSGPAK